MSNAFPGKIKAVVLHDWNDLRYEEVETPAYAPAQASPASRVRV